MSAGLEIPQAKDRAELYESLLPQIIALWEGEEDLVANLANTVAALKQAFGFFWMGFYIKREQQLVLGPFQGSVACTRIDFDKGVCGYCYRTKKTVIVPDVEKFPGHMACSSYSKSEIVLPVFKDGEVIMVLDIDSDKLDGFNKIDQTYLEKLILMLETNLI